VYANPNDWSRDELFLFLEKAGCPVTEDGCFLAYKNVTDNYLDIYSETFDNSIGSICEMPREDVDPDRERTCSYGLHFAAKDYLKHYRHGGSRTMVVKINPVDVISIPSDYDNTKGRTCKYEVVAEIPFEKVETYRWPSTVTSDYYAEEGWYEDETVERDVCESCGEWIPVEDLDGNGLCSDCVEENERLEEAEAVEAVDPNTSADVQSTTTKPKRAKLRWFKKGK
jgi:hypothetical protein